MSHAFAMTFRALLVAAASSILTATPATAGGQWSVVDTFAIPEGASGLAYDGTWLYCGIYGVNGGDVYRIDPSDGSATLLFVGPQDDAFGLTYDGTHLWTTHHPGGPSTPAVALQLDMSGNVIDQLDLPAHYMSGIASDGGDFWVARYYEDPSHIFRIDASGNVLSDFTAPDDQPWDVCIENDALWIADYFGDMLYKVDPTDGQVLASHASEGVEPAGVVWDGTHLWYCDNGEGGFDFLYKIDLQGSGTPEIGIPVSAHDYGLVSIGESITWNVTVLNTGDADLRIDAVTFDPAADLSCAASFPITVPAAGNTQLPLVFTPTGFGPLDAIATVVSNDPVHPAEDIALSGDAVFAEATIDLFESANDYGAVRAGAHTRWFMEVRNHGNEILTIDDLVVEPLVGGAGRFYVDPGVSLPLALAPLESVAIGVWFNPVAAASYAANLDVYSNDLAQSPLTVPLDGTGDEAEQPMGTVLWSYTIDNGFDNTPKAMSPIPDISGDQVADVIVCSEDDFIRCFNGNASGTGDVLWEHEIPGGSVYAQKGLQIVPDIDGDGRHDVIVGAAWGGKLIRALSGTTGAEIWTHRTDEYGDGGWVYQVDCRYDYNDDGTPDALAATGDDGQGTGPKRIYCLDGLTGVSIWERPLGGPAFAVIGVADFTGDGRPDVLAGASNASETQGRAYGIDGANGALRWTFSAAGSSVWALAQIGDVSADGIDDLIVGDFAGNVHGLDAVTGGTVYDAGGLGTTTHFVSFDDVDGDGHPEVVPAHFRTFARMIGGQDGQAVWTTALVDKPAAVARIPDISGDGINDVLVGTLFSNNRVYFLDGVDGAILLSQNYGTPVDGIGAIPDITGDGSWEIVVGGRNGVLKCLSGGLSAQTNDGDINNDGVVNFEDLLTLLSAWGWNPGHPADVNGDGVVDFEDLLIVLSSWT